MMSTHKNLNGESNEAVALKKVIRNYIRWRITKTKCMQRHMRQVCHRCRKVAKCKVISLEYRAWRELQDAIREEN